MKFMARKAPLDQGEEEFCRQSTWKWWQLCGKAEEEEAPSALSPATRNPPPASDHRAKYNWRWWGTQGMGRRRMVLTNLEAIGLFH